MLLFPQIPLLFLGCAAILIFLLARFLRMKNTMMAFMTALSFLIVFVYFFCEAPILHFLDELFPGFTPAVADMITPGMFASNDLGAVLICIVACGLFCLIALYSAEYLKNESRQQAFYSLLMLMLCGFIGMLFSDNLMIVYLFCELTSICAYTLVAFRRRKDTAIEAGFKYLIMGSVASVVLLMGIALLFQDTGMVQISQITAAGGLLSQIGLIMILVSFSLKSAFVPMHAWLPDAHGTAPSNISAILSGILVQGFFYTMLRVCLTLGMDRMVLSSILLGLSLLNILVGNLMGLVQKQTKRLLGYSTIAQMGYIGLCIAIGLQTQSTLALQAGFFLIIAHAIAKSLAFLVNGVYQHSFNAATIHDLQHADQLTPFLSAAFGVSVLSLAAIPPFPGFIGEWTFLTSAFSQMKGWSLVGAIALLAGSLVSLGYYLKLLRNLFFKPAQENREHPAGKRTAVSAWLLVPILVLLTLILVITVRPQGIMKWTEPAAQFLLMRMK